MTTSTTVGSFDDFNVSADRAQRASEYTDRLTGGSHRFADLLQSVRTLVGMLRAYRRGEFPMSWQEIVVLLTALLYVVNPFDAMPEAILGPAGLPDDAAAVVAAVGALTGAILRFRKRTA